MLDKRPLKTPYGAKINVNDKMLALLVAGEWEAMEKAVKPFSLPLVSIYLLLVDRIKVLLGGL